MRTLLKTMAVFAACSLCLFSQAASAQDYEGERRWSLVVEDCSVLPNDNGLFPGHPVQLLLGMNLSSRERCQLSRSFFFGLVEETVTGLAIQHRLFPRQASGSTIVDLFDTGDDILAISREGGTQREPEELKRLIRLVNNSRNRVLISFLLMEPAAAQCVSRNFIAKMPASFFHDMSPEGWVEDGVNPDELGPECPDLSLQATYHGDEGEAYTASLTTEDLNALLGKLRRMANIMRCEYPQVITYTKPSPDCPERMREEWAYSLARGEQQHCVHDPDDITLYEPVCQRFLTHQ